MRGFVARVCEAAIGGAAILGVGVALISGTAEAKETKEFTVGEWQGFSYTSDDNGAFLECDIWTFNRNNVQIGIRVKKDYTLSFWLNGSRWDLPKDKSYPVTYWVDQNPSYEGQVTASDPNFTYDPKYADINVDKGNEVFGELKQGSQLTFRTMKVDYIFDLSGSRAALSRLLDCVDQYAKADITNPFGGSSDDQQQNNDQQNSNQQNSNQSNDNQQQANQNSNNNNNSNSNGSSDDTAMKNLTVSADDVQKFLIDVTGAKPSMIQVQAKTNKSGTPYDDFTTPLGGGEFWQEKLGSEQLEDFASNYLDGYKKDCKGAYDPSVNKPVQGQHGQLASGTAACSNSPYQSNGPEFLSYSMTTAGDGIVSIYLTYTGGNAAKAQSDALGSLIEKRSEQLVQ